MLTKAEVEALSQSLSPISFLSSRDYLQSVYVWLKNLRKEYSYLQFAEDLSFSRTNVLHLIIRGKRPLTDKGGLKISEALGLRGKDATYFAAMVAYGNERDQYSRDAHLKSMLALREEKSSSSLQRFQMEYLSEWFHPVIREMCLLKEFQSDGGWIADHITPRIRPEQARKSLVLLEQIGMIRFDQTQGRHVPAEQTVSTGDDTDDVAVIRYHHAMIDLGKESITTIAEGDRDIGAITICADDETAEKIKFEVRAFRKKMLALAEQSHGTNRVYQMNIQYFPVTKSVASSGTAKTGGREK